ncbi:heat stress transcription factor A-2b [Phalaenopsis equestris]|uniref:heat stress transcription factor A-2b n=1 Tax=Phalaenopsis equestris TaxID=78828 RepID=UPI0009E5C37F|nr:heat stress transcription factor A-2b [Phalaenopsis equestris]
MEPPFPNELKEEKREGSSPRPSSSSATPRPMDGLQDSWPPPFLTKTYDMVNDAGTDQMVSWSKMNNSFVVWDPHSFAMELLPKHFKHNNFSSFVRQLNTYGFRKVDPDKWEFAHEGFLRGQKHLLMTIKRRRHPAHPSNQPQPSEACLEVGKYGLDGEIDQLKRDKTLLMSEVIKLRQDQQNSKARLQTMAEKLKGIEQKQQHMMSFLARAMQNPSFVDQLAEQKDKRKELEEAISKKRKRYINYMPANVNESTSQQQIQDPKSIYSLEGNDEISAFENLALEVHGLNEIQGEEENEDQQPEDPVEELNEEFWQELFNEMISDGLGTTELDLAKPPK